MNKKTAKIHYTYSMASGAALQTAHGVWGGINAQGEIEINFYNESDALPAWSEQLIAPDGSLGHEITPDDEDKRNVVRHVHSRVLLNYHTARAVLEWLEEQTAAMEEEGAPTAYGPNSDIAQ
jgi:hypothetical protein